MIIKNVVWFHPSYVNSELIILNIKLMLNLNSDDKADSDI